MEKDAYLTIEAPVSGSYKEKGSTFLSFTFPVSTEEDIRKYVQEYRKKYYDARHVCYAYSLGVKHPVLKASDDGEPAHTAGTPILNQIRSRNLSNVLVLVVRYSGGTKLGVSGLIDAYKESAVDCLNKTIIVEKYISSILEFSFQVPLQGEVMRIIKEYSGRIISQEYETEVILRVELRQSLASIVASKKIQGVLITILGEKNH